LAVLGLGCHSDPNPDSAVAESDAGVFRPNLETRQAPRMKSLETDISPVRTLKRTTDRIHEDQNESAALTGQLLHFPENQPVEDATVTIRPYGADTTSTLVQSTRTNADGTFQFS